MRVFRASGVLVTFLTLILLFQNCSNLESRQISELASTSSEDPPVDNSECLIGQTQSGYPSETATYPAVCGVARTRACVAGKWDGPALVPECRQSCIDPRSGAPVNAGTALTSFSAAQGATQAACDAARVNSVCQASTGQFAPAPAANSSCLVVGQTCAYSNAAGRAVPTGNLMGATVTGYAQPSAVAPTLCGAQVTRTCQANGQWTGTTPLYTACQQSCLHPDTNQPVAAGASYGQYYTRANGTQAECDAARVSAANSSTCSATTGMFTPTLPNMRYASCTVNPNNGGGLGAPLNAARIFVSGHSLTNWPITPDAMMIASSLGQLGRYNLQQISGSSIKQRTRGNSPEGSTQFMAYSQGLNREGSNMNVIQELLNPRTINGDRYDHLVITERHDLITAIMGDKTVKHLRHYHERFLAGNANGLTYFYHPWLSIVKSKPQEWLAYEAEAAKGWACVTTRLNHSLAAEGRPDRIRNLPASQALAFLVNRALNGNAPGITGANAMATLNAIFQDDVHLTRVGSYYMGAVVYASIYRRSPVGGQADNLVISATQRTTLQNLAWEFVSNYYSTFIPPTLAQCQALAPDLCNAFWNFDWLYANNPGRIPSCRADMMRADQEANPFYYNATTDRNYWLPAPQ